MTDNVIAVSYSHQVKKYSLQGELLSVIGCHSNINGQFNHSRGLAFNNNKLLYVVDDYNYRVQVFQQDDTFTFLFGSKGHNPGQFQDPIRIAVDHNNNVLVMLIVLLYIYTQWQVYTSNKVTDHMLLLVVLQVTWSPLVMLEMIIK